MFLDEELNQICEQKGFSKETSLELIKVCLKKIDYEHGYGALINSLKRTDASWKLFCKKHKEYKPDGFRIVYLHTLGDDNKGKLLADKVKKMLKW